MKKFCIILLCIIQILHTHSREEFHLSTSFDHVKLDQKKRRFVSDNKWVFPSQFDKYNNKSTGKIWINYGTLDLNAAIAQVEDAPKKRGKNALHFKIMSPNVEKDGKKIKSRIQIEFAKIPGFKSFVSEVSVFLPTSMKELNNYPNAITWLTLQEFWNAPVSDTGKTFRITIGLRKSKEGKIYFEYRSQDYIGGKFINVARSDNDSCKVPIGRWFRLRTEIIEGDKDSGFFCLTIKDGKEEKVIYRFKTQTMATVFCEKQYPRQGFTSLHPIKLYTSAQLTEWMKERGCAIEAYFTDWKFDGVPYSSYNE